MYSLQSLGKEDTCYFEVGCHPIKSFSCDKKDYCLRLRSMSSMIRGGSSGGPIRPCPPSKLAMEFAPLEGRKSNDSTVNLLKSKDFGPVSISATDLILPYGKLPHENIKKVDG